MRPNDTKMSIMKSSLSRDKVELLEYKSRATDQMGPGTYNPQFLFGKKQ